MTFDLILRGGTLPDGRGPVDIGISGERITAMETALQGEARETIDITGNLVAPPFVDIHFHMDATLSYGQPRINASGTLLEGITLWSELKPELTHDAVVDRALAYCDWAVSQGLLAIRSHVDICDDRLLAAQALIDVREQVKPYIDLQLVAFPQDGYYRNLTAAVNLERALDMGIDVVGGIPHFERTMEDGRRSVTALCEIAARRGLRVDMHCDESDDPMSRHVETLASEAHRLGLQGRVTGSHLTSMHSMDNYYASKLLDLMVDAELSAVPNPLINIVLQGRHDSYPKRRGMTRVPEMLARGIPVAFGQDCVLDPWYSLGTADMLDVAFMGLHVAQMTSPDAMRQCFDLVTETPARIMGLEGYGIYPGAMASLVVLEASDPVEAIRLRATRLHVIAKGRHIASTPPRQARLSLKGRPELVDRRFKIGQTCSNVAGYGGAQMSDSKHIVLTSHPPQGGAKPVPIVWGADNAADRGPVIGGFNVASQRNVIGVHSGAYGLYRALAIAAGTLDPVHRPDFTNTSPTVRIGPFPQWADPNRIVSIDPYGHMGSEAFREHIEAGMDIRPTIAVTRARIGLPEFRGAIADGRLKPDGEVLTETGEANVTKAAIEPVWYLPGIANRLKLEESDLRRSLFEYTGGMFSELVTRTDLNVFLPPIGNITLYIFGDIEAFWDKDRALACRVHDECNGSDVFGSDICTCRPYLTHGIEECVKTAQQGGAGLIVYNRKEGRALGEVTKFLVYNARKRNPEGDSAAAYFERTECVAGVQDMRFQDLMPDVFHWLGITRIDRFMSMSNMKYDALAGQGIEIGERVPIPDDLIPPDAMVEMDAKKAAGYFTDETVSPPNDLNETKGRGLDDY